MSTPQKVRYVADPPILRRLDTTNNLRNDAYGRLWLAALVDAIRIVTEPLPRWVTTGATAAVGNDQATTGRLEALARRIDMEVCWLMTDGVVLARALSVIGFEVSEDMVLDAAVVGRNSLMRIRLLIMHLRQRNRTGAVGDGHEAGCS